MGFDLYRMFTKLQSSSHIDDMENRNKRFRKYSVYGWLVPSMILSIVLLKQFIQNNISYGFNVCFLSRKIDILIFFVIPIASILLVNFIFLILTIRSILKVDKMTHSVFKKDKSDEKEKVEESSKMSKYNLKQKLNKKMVRLNDSFKSEKKRFILFIKLFFLTGMTWVLGLLAALDNDSILWYAFITLNSLQGLFIFSSFAFNTQTQKELKKNSTFRTLSEMISSSKSESTKSEAVSSDAMSKNMGKNSI